MSLALFINAPYREFLAIHLRFYTRGVLPEIRKRQTRKTTASSGFSPLEAVYVLRFIRSHAVHSYGNERYGRICHSKYTNPAAIADTTTKCMNILPAIDCW
jgi:hypothetical protein